MLIVKILIRLGVLIGKNVVGFRLKYHSLVGAKFVFMI